MQGAGLSCRQSGKAPLGKPAFQPYWGKLAVRNDRGDRGNVGIIRSPIRASILPNQQRHRLRDFDAAQHAQRVEYHLRLSPSRKAIASSSTRTASMTRTTGRAWNSKAGNIEQNL